MTTVVQTTHTQPGGYPPPQQQGYPPQTGYPQSGYPPITVSGNPGRIERYNGKAGLVTGVLQICAGGILILFGIIALALGSWYSLGWSIWGSICFYIVAGILGVVSKNQNRCVIIAYMVMSILSAVGAGSQMIYDAAAAGNSRFLGSFYCGTYTWTWPYTSDGCSRQKSIIAMHSLSALTGLAEMIIAIIGAGYCCSGCCGTHTPTQTTVVTYGQPAPPAAQVTVVNATSYPPQGQAAPPLSYPQGQAAPPPSYPQAQAAPSASYPQGQAVPPPMNAYPPAYGQHQPMPQQPYVEPLK
ncbi:uncharacterized protein [Amphiura filiformis]|uniref:uncharacterized protein n=1 Tax=Amphiura filiformis TaxID=82378 RepID=UPI003B22267B